LVEHIKDVCRRAARAGFVAIAPDLLSRQGGVQAFPEPTQQTAAYGRTTPDQRRSDLIAALDYLKFSPMCQFDRIGATGFCAGGANVWDLAVYLEELAVAVPFYGAPPAVELIQQIQAPVLAIYADRDRGLTARMAPVLTELLARQKRFGFSVYEGVGHAFVIRGQTTTPPPRAMLGHRRWRSVTSGCGRRGRRRLEDPVQANDREEP
jgi:carboxymethylenebutenolidase